MCGKGQREIEKERERERERERKSKCERESERVGEDIFNSSFSRHSFKLERTDDVLNAKKSDNKCGRRRRN